MSRSARAAVGVVAAPGLPVIAEWMGSADFVQQCMRASRSRSIVLLLDCCYGGAFSQGVTVRAAGNVNVLDSFPGGKLGGLRQGPQAEPAPDPQPRRRDAG